jgi:cytochrome P450
VIVIARLLGVPEAMAPDLLRWSNAMVMMYQAGRSRADEDAAVAATIEFVAFMRDYVDRRRSDPRDDLISALIAAEEDGARLTTDEMITTCILLLNAGHEATVHTLGNAVKLALETARGPGPTPRPSWRRCCATTRRCTSSPAGPTRRWRSMATFSVAATRWGCCWPRPGGTRPSMTSADRFVPDRSDGPANLAFGAGLHFCVGAPLARLEMQIALPILFQRCPGLTLAETPRYADIYHFHGLEALRVRC